MITLNELTYEIKLCLGGRRKGNFNFLETYLAEHAKHTHLAFHIHRLDQRLIAIAKICAHPDGRRSDGFVRPLAVDDIHRRKRTVLGGGLL